MHLSAALASSGGQRKQCFAKGTDRNAMRNLTQTTIEVVQVSSCRFKVVSSCKLSDDRVPHDEDHPNLRFDLRIEVRRKADVLRFF